MGSKQSRRISYPEQRVNNRSNNHVRLDENVHSQQRSQTINYSRQIIHPSYISSSLEETLTISQNNIKNNIDSKLSIYHIIILEIDDIELQPECPICLDEFIIKDEVYLFPCCHYYHKKCLEDWLKNKDFCPNCRITLGKHSQEEIDLALSKREDKLIQGRFERLKRINYSKYNENISKIEEFEQISNESLDKSIENNNSNISIVVIDSEDEKK